MVQSALAFGSFGMLATSGFHGERHSAEKLQTRLIYIK